MGEGVEIGLNCEYKERWECIVREQIGVSGWKITKRKHQGKGEIFAKPTHLNLLKAGQGAQTSPQGGGGWGTSTDIEGDQTWRMGDSG